MASWKRFFNTPTPLKNQGGNSSELMGSTALSQQNSIRETFTGPSNRFERYNQFDILDRDPIVNQALNTIAEFCTQENHFTKLPFDLRYGEDISDTETIIIKETLSKWCYINTFKNRLFYIVRNTLKYGDTFFVRDPETFELHYVDPRNVEKIVVDETQGKKVHSYFIRNVSLNLANKIFTHDTRDQHATGFYNFNSTPRTQNSVGQSTEIPAQHVVHITLNSTGMDYISWPFSASIIDPVYKTAKQKELLEQAFLIYTIQRAPERRAFYIYTGDKPSHQAMQYVERFKNELHQKRIPTRQTDGQQSLIDGGYNAQHILEDFYFPVNSEGQGPRVEMLSGSDAMASGVDNLAFFNNLILRGLGIPTSYIPNSGEESQITFNDGKTGVALLQEWRFAQSCMRIQRLLIDVFDFEFKLFCKKRGLIFNSSEFNLEFEEPQSFGEYRQMEKDSTQLNVVQQALGIEFISKRFALKRFGGFSDEEIKENERLWKEENKSKIVDKVADIEIGDLQNIGLNNVGIKKPSGEEDEDETE